MKVQSVLLGTVFCAVFAGVAFAHGNHSAPKSTNYEKISKRKASVGLSRKGCVGPNCVRNVAAPKRWNLSAGLTVTGYISSESTKQSEVRRVPTLADEGHDHSAAPPSENDSGSGGEAGNSISPTFDIGTGFLLIDPLLITAAGSYTYGSGLSDITVGPAANFTLAHHFSMPTSIGFSIPVSEASEKNSKITTLTATIGLRDAGHTWVKGITLLSAFSWYSKTVVYTEEPHQDDLSLANSQLPRPESEASSEKELNAGVSKREFNRFGLNGDLLYNINSAFSLGSAASLTFITHQFDPPSWVTDLTFAKGLYKYAQFASSLGMALSREATSISFPNSFRITAAARYEL